MVNRFGGARDSSKLVSSIFLGAKMRSPCQLFTAVVKLLEKCIALHQLEVCRSLPHRFPNMIGHVHVHCHDDAGDNTGGNDDDDDYDDDEHDDDDDHDDLDCEVSSGHAPRKYGNSLKYSYTPQLQP